MNLLCIIYFFLRYLLRSNSNNKIKDLSTFKTFFDFTKVSESIDVITMKEYLEKIALKGLLYDQTTTAKRTIQSTSTTTTTTSSSSNDNNSIPLYPREDLVKTLGVSPDTKWLWPYLEKTSYVRQW